jgi:hypothetical protein
VLIVFGRSEASETSKTCGIMNEGQAEAAADFEARPHIMLRDLLALKCVTDFGYPRACRFRIYQIENT